VLLVEQVSSWDSWVRRLEFGWQIERKIREFNEFSTDVMGYLDISVSIRSEEII